MQSSIYIHGIYIRATLAPNSGADRQGKQSESQAATATATATTQHGDVIMSGPFSRSTVQQMLATSSPFGGSNFVIITARAHAHNCPRFDDVAAVRRANRVLDIRKYPGFPVLCTLDESGCLWRLLLLRLIGNRQFGDWARTATDTDRDTHWQRPEIQIQLQPQIQILLYTFFGTTLVDVLVASIKSLYIKHREQ
nr:uncharacterized protein LOC118876953 isoform X2 [Drosophila suzukii]